ncbi:MAG: DUF3098 domain-containing protein [Duncaniella sp.]|nr:DUF3098 domain-containing protein [Duncaniella sp.]
MNAKFSQDTDRLDKQSPSSRPLGPANFKLMAVSGIIIIVGFLLMLGSGNDGGVFNEEIFSVRRVVVGPSLAFVGFICMGVGIIWKSDKK